MIFPLKAQKPESGQPLRLVIGFERSVDADRNKIEGPESARIARVQCRVGYLDNTDPWLFGLVNTYDKESPPRVRFRRP